MFVLVRLAQGLPRLQLLDLQHGADNEFALRKSNWMEAFGFSTRIDLENYDEDEEMLVYDNEIPCLCLPLAEGESTARLLLRRRSDTNTPFYNCAGTWKLFHRNNTLLCRRAEERNKNLAYAISGSNNSTVLRSSGSETELAPSTGLYVNLNSKAQAELIPQKNWPDTLKSLANILVQLMALLGSCMFIIGGGVIFLESLAYALSNP
jgi:hypothetical protein